MPVILDNKVCKLPAHLTPESTVGDHLKWARTLLPTGRIVVRISLNDAVLEGPALSHSRRDRLGSATLSLVSANQKELSLTMLGKLAALIEWLNPQHKDVAGLIEQGNTRVALDRLTGIISAWQQIQSAYGNLAKMMCLSVSDLPVHEMTGETVLNEFCRQLEEMQTALQNQDFVLLADILQYEMDGAVANWMALLESTLGVVEPETVQAGA
jgi:hypothetical protein